MAFTGINQQANLHDLATLAASTGTPPGPIPGYDVAPSSLGGMGQPPMAAVWKISRSVWQSQCCRRITGITGSRAVMASQQASAVYSAAIGEGRCW